MPTPFFVLREKIVMAWYGKRLPNFVSDTTEERLRKRLADISLNIGEKLEVMTIYPRGGKIVAWYFLDAMKVSQLPEAEQPGKKVTKKKTTKKKNL